MMILLALALSADPVPTITLTSEGNHYRLAVDFFREKEAKAVETAAEKRMKALCGDKAIEPIDTDFETVDPGGGLGEPPAGRAIWNYWRTFTCVDRSLPGKQE